jgi:hypothetical protein
MPGTLLFVHGTGVRQEGLRAKLDAIRDGCRWARLTDIEIEGVSWGEIAGVTTDLIEVTLPPDASRDATGKPQIEEQEVALWDILLDDPLFELRIAGQAGAAVLPTIVVGEIPPGEALADSVRALSANRSGLELDSAGVSHDDWTRAIDMVADSPELAAAASAADAGGEVDVADAAARAVVASVLAAELDAPEGEGPPILYSSAQRDALVERVTQALAPGTARGDSSWTRELFVGFVERRATKMVARRRTAMTVGGLPALGDILYYEKRGEKIREVVAGALAGVEKRPLVALGHSLGGIILVDVLTQAKPPAVDALVTVGSQSPVLYAIDALDRIRRRETGPSPTPFVPWLNIYDRSDFLAFVARPLFSGISDIRDEEVVSQVPFPPAHSAYFFQQRTYDLIRDFWPK